MQTGQKLQKLRVQANMTQEELAEKLFVSRELVSKWETGERRPYYKTLTALSEILSVSPDEIIEKNDLIINELSECIPKKLQTKNIDIELYLNPFLRALPEQSCNIFIKRYYNMEDITEIAQQCGLRDGNVRLILHRTRKKLKKYFSEVCENE